ncbi:MAG: glucan biosynthesis protein, partial [Sphingobium sp.]
PLINPDAPHVSSFTEPDAKGFGLLQRDRNFDHYQDDGVFYERRPSLYATPRDSLGKGQVRLYEYSADSEYNDNVAAYWVPATPARPGRRINVAYRLDWQDDAPPAVTAPAHLVDLFRGKLEGNGIQLVLDFANGPAEKDGVTIWTEAAQARVVKSVTYPVLGQPGRWRAVIDIMPDAGLGAEIRAQLRRGDGSISEMVHYPLNA